MNANLLYMSAAGEAAEGATEGAAEFFFEPMNFVTNLAYMGKGMLSILIVIGVIILGVGLLRLLTRKRKKKDEE